MSLDWIATPVSEDAPAGPDLWEDDDEAYGDYYFNALDRLPEPEDYMKPGIEYEGRKASPDQIFDPKSVDLKGELAQIDSLLKRTRDLRLLTLRAQFAMLAADLAGAVESVEMMAALIDAMPVAAHPSLADGTQDRLEAINDLSAPGPMILPLRFFRLAGTDASVRSMMVARGEATGLDPEQDLDADMMLRELAGSGDALEEDAVLLGRFEAALAQIADACLRSDTPHTPQLSMLSDEIAKVKALIAEAAPSLVAAPESTPDAAARDADTDASAPASAPGGTVTVVTPATEVTSHDEARARLSAVEAYFGQHEPSSATILLVTQARELIGKSLIDAFETLMPTVSDRAKVDFLPEAGFRLDHDKLRELANQVESTPSAAVSDESPPAPDSFTVSNAAEASNQIKAVEAYFRAVEKSSPVPVLLARARSYIGKDFEALMREFIPREN